jgi:hypothetical protein
MTVIFSQLYRTATMPYYIYIVTSNETSKTKSARLVSEFDGFKEARTEVKRLRIEEPLDSNQIYKINFSDSEAAAEKNLTDFREEPITREWEK